MSTSSSNDIDYLIVGLSTSSCALIRKLLDNDPGINIVVLEAGSNTKNDDTSVTSILSEMEHSINAKYPTTARLNWGGSGVLHHSNIWALNSPEHWDAWQEVGGGQDWSYDTISGLLREFERFNPNGVTLLERDADRRLRAARGVVPVQQLLPNPFALYFAETIARLSAVNVLSDYNAGAATVVDSAAQVWSHRSAPRIKRLTEDSSSDDEENYKAKNKKIPHRKWHQPVETWLSEELNFQTGQRRNLRVISHVAVQRVLFQTCSSCGGDSKMASECTNAFHVNVKKPLRAIGVEYVENGVQRMFAHNVILSAGFLGSSQILERSGIIDPVRGKSLNIPVVLANCNVGEHLTHSIGPTMIMRRNPATCVVSQTATATQQSVPSATPLGTWRPKHHGPISFLPWIKPSRSAPHGCRVKDVDLRRWHLVTQPWILSPSQFTQFINLYRIHEMNIITPCKTTITAALCDNKSKTIVPPKSHLAQMIMYDLAPTSRGSVHIVAPHLFTPPQIRFNYYTTPRDLETGLHAMRFMYRVFKTLQQEHPEDDLELVYPPDESAFKHLDSAQVDQALTPYLQASIGTDAYCGQCRLSRTRKHGVVNRRLKVHGTRNLYVCDMSVTPVPPDGDAVSTAMLIGMNLARMLRESRRNRAENDVDQDSDNESVDECSDTEVEQYKPRPSSKSKQSKSHRPRSPDYHSH